MPYRFRTRHRQLTLAEAEAILSNVPDKVYPEQSRINPQFTKQMALGIFKGACLDYRNQGRDGDFLLGGPISANIIEEFGMYEDKGEAHDDADA